jgi:hypothetical protein
MSACPFFGQRDILATFNLKSTSVIRTGDTPIATLEAYSCPNAPVQFEDAMRNLDSIGFAAISVGAILGIGAASALDLAECGKGRLRGGLFVGTLYPGTLDHVEWHAGGTS